MGCVKWMRSYVTSLEVVMFLFMFGLFMVVITSQVRIDTNINTHTITNVIISVMFLFMFGLFMVVITSQVTCNISINTKNNPQCAGGTLRQIQCPNILVPAKKKGLM